MGAWETIVDYTVPSNTTSVTLNNFGTITKDDFIKVFTNITTTSSVSVNLYPNNNLTNSNYHTQALWGSGTGVNAARFTGPDFMFSVSGQFGSTSAYLKLSENNKFNFFRNSNIQDNSSVEVSFGYATSTVDFTSITSLTFQPSSGSISTGSRIQIYRLAAEKVADIVVSSNTTQVDITGLDIQKGSEYLLVSDYVTPNGSVYRLGVNNNTTLSNYYFQLIQGAGSTASAERGNQQAYGFIASASSTLRTMMYSHIKLSNIGAFTHQAYEIRNYGSNTVEAINWAVSSTAENITSINQLNITSSATNAIGTGTLFQLYKLY
jgi:hypothetical protein